MNAIYINEEQWAEVQPGVVRDELNYHLKEHGLFSAPIPPPQPLYDGRYGGNNSSGSTSISYGTTREKLLGLEFVTATEAARHGRNSVRWCMRHSFGSGGLRRIGRKLGGRKLSAFPRCEHSPKKYGVRD